MRTQTEVQDGNSIRGTHIRDSSSTRARIPKTKASQNSRQDAETANWLMPLPHYAKAGLQTGRTVS